MTIDRRLSLLAFPLLLLASVGAHAQFAVIDVASIAQLVQQAQTLAQQLETARAQLAQAQSQYQAMTGNRGMQSLLSGTVRNYLPAQWSQLTGVLQAGGGAYATLAANVQGNVTANSVLTAQQLLAMPAEQQALINSSRDIAALLQGLSQVELANVSGRFASIQQLIDAIPSAGDQKAILDLQARINAEQGMLQNEQTKLQVLYQSVQAQQRVSAQRQHELVIAGYGQFATRFEPSPR
jgi:type IV secretion system protein VirB5